MKRFHVCGETGDDRWSGTLAEPDAARQDGPFRTLAAAQAVVRRTRAGMKKDEAETIEVVIRGGLYTLAEPYIDGSFVESNVGETLVQNYLNFYVFSKLAWDGKIDVEAVPEKCPNCGYEGEFEIVDEED